MKKQIKWGDKGQVLVQVALGLVVLLLMVGLAIDGGNVYAERRRMQNAADAGALAGARAICTGDGDPYVMAYKYAEDKNGADYADVHVDLGTGIVTVTTTKEVDTFLMGLAGFNTVNVKADAAAICGSANSGGGLAPIAFDWVTWRDVITCTDAFVVWSDLNGTDDIRTDIDLCQHCKCQPLTDTIEQYDDWNGTPNEWSGKIVAGLGGKDFPAGDRGWLRLGSPPPIYESEYSYPGGSCGASGTGFWMKHGYPEVETLDCVAADPGVKSSVLKDAKTRVGDTVGIVIYDGSCPADEALGTCPGRGYLKVVDFGCVKIVKVFEGEDKLSLDDNDPSDGISCPNNYKGILVIKVCDESCYTVGGSGSGNPAQSGDMRAAVLIE